MSEEHVTRMAFGGRRAGKTSEHRRRVEAEIRAAAQEIGAMLAPHQLKGLVRTAMKTVDAGMDEAEMRAFAAEAERRRRWTVELVTMVEEAERARNRQAVIEHITADIFYDGAGRYILMNAQHRFDTLMELGAVSTRAGRRAA